MGFRFNKQTSCGHQALSFGLRQLGSTYALGGHSSTWKTSCYSKHHGDFGDKMCPNCWEVFFSGWCKVHPESSSIMFKILALSPASTGCFARIPFPKHELVSAYLHIWPTGGETIKDQTLSRLAHAFWIPNLSIGWIGQFFCVYSQFLKVKSQCFTVLQYLVVPPCCSRV